MIEKSGDPDFVYEISCDQMCGKGHYGMRGVVIVETRRSMTGGSFHKNRSIHAAHPETSSSKITASRYNKGCGCQFEKTNF